MRRRLNLDFAAVVAVGAAGAVWINALWLQEGPHPAPLFSVELPAARSSPANAGPQTRTDVAARMRDLQRGLRALGFYDGPVDGIDGPRTRMAIAAYQKANGLDGSGVADQALYRQVRLASRDLAPVPPVPPVRRAPDADKRILAVQKVLAELGYAPGRIDGRLGSQTRAAIERFERDHKMKVSGQISAAFMRKLSAMSGVAFDEASDPPLPSDRKPL